MKTLRQKRCLFTKHVSILIQYAFAVGYEVAGDDLVRKITCSHGSQSSKHRRGLAIDLNLYINGDYQRKTKAHIKLGKFWESLPHCKWGGRFEDGNHYEWSDLEWQNKPFPTFLDESTTEV